MNYRPQGEPKVIPLPRDISLPFFAYGSLKPGEPAHHQIEGFLAETPSEAVIEGCLWVRDGLPLLETPTDCPTGVQGFLLKFKPELYREAYEAICSFEPRKHYSWRSQVLRGLTNVVNVLVGKKLSRGRAVQLETGSWTLLDDPVFRFGLAEVDRVLSSDAVNVFVSAPPNDFDWPRFFRLQMAYLLLWSAIERFSAFLLSPSLEPMARITQLGDHEVFQSSFLKAGVTRKDEVCDSRDPSKSFSLDSANPAEASLYYYQVRNNLSHRGKGAWADGEVVRNSLVELKSIFDLILAT
jgi:hypothetical protein